MGTAFGEQVKDIISAFTHFIEETLSREKLSSKAEEEKKKLKKLVEAIKETFPALRSESEWSKDNQQSVSKSDSTPNLYDTAAKSSAISGSDLLTQADISGYLKKKSDGIMGKPKKKWCGIMGDVFYIYEKQTDKKQKGQIDLSNASVKKYDGGKKAPPFGFEVVCPSGNHVFFASNETEQKSWMNALGFEEAAPPPPPIDDEDDQDMYEEFESPGSVQPPPKAQPVIPAQDDEEDIYEDDDVIRPVQPNKPLPVVPSKQDRPLPVPVPTASPIQKKPLPPRPDSDLEIYDDMANPEEEMDEFYDDVDVNATAASAIRPHALPKTESKPISVPKKPLPEPPGINYENLYYALWSRTADQPDELSFKQADILLVKNKIFDRHAWWAAEAGGQVGYVPKNFLTPVYVAV